MTKKKKWTKISSKFVQISKIKVFKKFEFLIIWEITSSAFKIWIYENFLLSISCSKFYSSKQKDWLNMGFLKKSPPFHKYNSRHPVLYLNKNYISIEISLMI